MRYCGGFAALGEEPRCQALARCAVGPSPWCTFEHFAEERGVPECPVEMLGVFGLELFAVDLTENLEHVEPTHLTRVPPWGIGLGERHTGAGGAVPFALTTEVGPALVEQPDPWPPPNKEVVT